MNLLQQQPEECGVACLAYCASMLGLNADLADIRKLVDVPDAGLSLRLMLSLAQSIGLEFGAIKFDLNEIPILPIHSILHFKAGHFVVLTGFPEAGITIFDPQAGSVRLNANQCSSLLSGYALKFLQLI